MSSNARLRWFAFRQNNVRGFFVEDANLGRWVLIEAPNEQAANDKLVDLGARYDRCGCCGCRWSDPRTELDEPLIYGNDWRSEPGSVRVHHADGRVESKDV